MRCAAAFRHRLARRIGLTALAACALAPAGMAAANTLTLSSPHETLMFTPSQVGSVETGVAGGVAFCFTADAGRELARFTSELVSEEIVVRWNGNPVGAPIVVREPILNGCLVISDGHEAETLRHHLETTTK